MANAQALTIIDPSEAEERSEAFEKLSRQQKTFVDLYLTTSLTQTQCVARAYPNCDQRIHHVEAARLMGNKRVREALHEETIRCLAGSAAVGLRVLLEVAGDPTHKDRLKAARELIAHAGLAPKVEQTINVNHTGPSPGEQRAELQRLMAQMGPDGQRLLAAADLKIVDAEFTVVDGNSLGPDGEAW